MARACLQASNQKLGAGLTRLAEAGLLWAAFLGERQESAGRELPPCPTTCWCWALWRVSRRHCPGLAAFLWPRLAGAQRRAAVISAGSGGAGFICRENKPWRGERATKQEAAHSSLTAEGKLPGAAGSVGVSKTKEASNKGQAEERSVFVSAGRPGLGYLCLAPRPPSCPAAVAAGGSREKLSPCPALAVAVGAVFFLATHLAATEGRGSWFHSQHERLCGAARCRRGQSPACLRAVG